MVIIDGGDDSWQIQKEKFGSFIECVEALARSLIFLSLLKRDAVLQKHRRLTGCVVQMLINWLEYNVQRRNCG